MCQRLDLDEPVESSVGSILLHALVDKEQQSASPLRAAFQRSFAAAALLLPGREGDKLHAKAAEGGSEAAADSRAAKGSAVVTKGGPESEHGSGFAAGDGDDSVEVTAVRMQVQESAEPQPAAAALAAAAGGHAGGVAQGQGTANGSALGNGVAGAAGVHMFDDPVLEALKAQAASHTAAQLAQVAAFCKQVGHTEQYKPSIHLSVVRYCFFGEV